MHGRRTLALINSIDAVLLTYAFLILLLLLDAIDAYDTLLIAAHWPHAITVPLGRLIVRKNTLLKQVLRVLVFLYIVALVFDIVAFALRLILLTGVIAHTNTLAAPTAAAVKCGLALCFVGIDLCGAFFGDFARQYALAPVRNDAQTLAAARVIALQPELFREDVSQPALGPRITTVYSPARLATIQHKLPI